MMKRKGSAKDWDFKWVCGVLKSGSGVQYLLASMARKKRKECSILKSWKIFPEAWKAPHLLL
jgi:hypothetical protein